MFPCIAQPKRNIIYYDSNLAGIYQGEKMERRKKEKGRVLESLVRLEPELCH
jgi:hypothetical protein